MDYWHANDDITWTIGMLTMTSHGLFKVEMYMQYFMLIRDIYPFCDVIHNKYNGTRCMNCWYIGCGGWLLMEFFPTHVYNSYVMIAWLLYSTFFGHTQHIEFTLQCDEMTFPISQYKANCYIYYYLQAGLEGITVGKTLELYNVLIFYINGHPWHSYLSYKLLQKFWENGPFNGTTITSHGKIRDYENCYPWKRGKSP